MPHSTPVAATESKTPIFSPLVLADRLLDLASAADRAGMQRAADHLVRLACSVCDERPAAHA